MASKTYYQILQVDSAASPEVIEAAYRRLARIYHPDVNSSPDAMRQMQAINEAYACLSDVVKRHAYDMQQVQAAASASASATHGLRPATGTISQLTIRASLRYQGRSGSDDVISIGSADDFDAVVEELKRRIPVRKRRYEPYSKRRYIADDYEFVLYHLFDNYSPFGASAQPEPVRTIPSLAYVPPVASTRPTHQANNIPKHWMQAGVTRFSDGYNQHGYYN